MKYAKEITKNPVLKEAFLSEQNCIIFINYIIGI